MQAAHANEAYAQGYAHGSILKLAMRRGGEMPEPVQAMHAQYLAQIKVTRPNESERAYVGGFRDAVSDNLPRPPLDLAETMPRLRVV